MNNVDKNRIKGFEEDIADLDDELNKYKTKLNSTSNEEEKKKLLFLIRKTEELITKKRHKIITLNQSYSDATE